MTRGKSDGFASPLEHAFKSGVSIGIELGQRDSSQSQGETYEQAKCDAWLAYEATMGVAAEWQAIDNAPRDGTEFLSAGGINGTDGKAYSTRYLSPGPYTTENGKNTVGERRYQWPDGFYWAGYDGFVGPVDPTIWMPTPVPPSKSPHGGPSNG